MSSRVLHRQGHASRNQNTSVLLVNTFRQACIAQQRTNPIEMNNHHRHDIALLRSFRAFRKLLWVRFPTVLREAEASLLARPAMQSVMHSTAKLHAGSKAA